MVKKVSEIADMKAKIKNAEIIKKLSVMAVVINIKKIHDKLANNLKNKVTESQLFAKSLSKKIMLI